MVQNKENEMMNRNRWSCRTRVVAVMLAVLVFLSVIYSLRQSGTALTGDGTQLCCTFTPEAGEGYADFAVHTHTADCYDQNGVLICPLPEIPFHTHTEECFEETRVLRCELPESAGHVHDESCYELLRSGLICGLEEDENHTHTDECYEWTERLCCGLEEGEGAHTHTDECYETETRLICEKREVTREMLHTHTPECFDENGVLCCGKMQLLEHIHGEECFAPVQAEEPSESQDSETPEESSQAEESCESSVNETPEESSQAEESSESSVNETPEESSQAEESSESSVNETPEESSQAEESSESSVNETPEESSQAEESSESSVNETPEGSSQAEESSESSVNEAPEEPSQQKMPAQTFRSQVDGLLILVEAPQGAFPEGTRMSAAPVYDEAILNTAADSVEGSICAVSAVDITFRNAEGEEIEPLLPIRVSLTPSEGENGEQVVVHVDDDGNTTVMEQQSGSGEEIVFEAESFSVYALVTVALEDTILASDGQNYRIAVTCGPEAQIPQDASLAVEEIEETEEYLEKALAALENRTVSFARFFEITIVSAEGEELQPAAPVQVAVTLAELSGEETAAVHFEEPAAQPEVIEASTEGETVTFEASGFSVYGIVVTEPTETDPFGLDGKSYGIINNQDTVSGIALNTNSGDNGTTLGGKETTVRIEPIKRTENVFVAQNDTIPMWTFTQIEENQGKYYVATMQGDELKYLRIASGSVSLVSGSEIDENCVIQVEAGSGRYSGKYKFSSGNYAIIRDGKKFKSAANKTGSAANANYWMNFAEHSTLNDDDFVVYTAQKVSVSGSNHDDNGKIIYDVNDGDQVVIYTRIWNSNTKRYDYYAIDYDGMLVKAYDNGDTISWVGSKVNTMIWDFTEYHYDDGSPNFYYELQNAYSGKYIAPQVSGDGFLSDNTIGINLNGRRNEEYYTTVLAWDDPYYDYASLMVRDWKLISAPLARADTFYFAVMSIQEQESEEPTPVATLDHTAYGITLKMSDYGDTYKENNNYRSREMNNVLGATPYQQWTGTQYLLEKNFDTLYPNTNTNVTKTAQQHSLSELFLPEKTLEVNQNFLVSTYNETGYFEYDSTQNFAHLITSADDYWYGKPAPNGTNYGIGDFVVYDEIATSNEGNKDTLRHGQFFPYNDLIKYNADGTWVADDQGEPVYRNYSTKYYNTMDIHANPLSSLDPRKGESLYEIPYSEGKTSPQYVNHFFGMEMSASFMQSESGKDGWGHDLIFEFSGDDDFWLYIDGKLVLDLGGIHSALDGSINFRTGEVRINVGHSNGRITDLRTLYREAYLEDHPSAGEEEIEAWLDGYFTENENGVKTIFKDYSGHTMRMFYLERGAGASNIHMRFNLAPYNNGEVQLQKKVTGVETVDPGMRFAYQIFCRDPERPDGQSSLVGNDGEYNFSVRDSETVDPIPYAASYTAGGVEYRHVFLLAPEQTALIQLPSEESEYYIQECGVNTAVYDQVKANDAVLEGTPTTPPAENLRDYPIDPATVAQRKKVIYENHVDSNVQRSLLITKKLWEDYEKTRPITAQSDPTVFRFRISIGKDSNGKNLLYNTGKYYVKDPEGYYCVYENGGFVRAPSNTQVFSELSDVVPEGEWKSEQERATFYTSPGGAVDKIPAGYSVEIPNLMAGMPFFIEERDNEIPAGYNRIDYERVDGAPEGETPNEGEITTARDEKIIVNNQHGYGLTVEKKWSDAAFMEDHDEIYFAVYLKNGDEETLLENSVRQLGKKETSIRWFFPELEEGKTLNDYLVYEVMLNLPEGTEAPTVDPETGVVSGFASLEKLEEGETLIAGGTGNDHGYSDALSYTVGYKRDFLTQEQIAQRVNSRGDIVSNTRPGIRIVKTDYTGETMLSGAKFSFEKENNPTSRKYFTSDEEGLVAVAYLAAGEAYVLTETAAPYQYRALIGSLTVSVDENWNVTVNGSGESGEFYTITQVENPTAEHMPTISIKNKPFTLRALKLDSHSKIPVAGITFALYREVIDYYSNLPMPDYSPMEGFEALETGADGVIPKITLLDLRPGNYYLREADTSDDYQPLDCDIRLIITKTNEVRIQKAEKVVGSATGSTHWNLSDFTDSSVAELIEDENGILILNVYNKPTKTIRLLKKSYKTEGPLADAEFKLYRVNQLDENLLPKEGEEPIDSWTTDETGLHEIAVPLSNNTSYYLFETGAPLGYVLLSAPVILTRFENGTVTAYLNDTPLETLQTTENGVETVQFTVYNSVGVVLPMTGGKGVTPYYLAGAFFIVCAAILMLRRRKILSRES